MAAMATGVGPPGKPQACQPIGASTVRHVLLLGVAWRFGDMRWGSACAQVGRLLVCTNHPLHEDQALVFARAELVSNCR